MLVLTRKTGEKITVTGPCEITVVSIDRNKIRIGIAADPKSVTIVRSELLKDGEAPTSFTDRLAK